MTWPATLDFRQLREAVSLEQVLAAKGLLGAFHQRGDNLVGPCPLHRGDNPQAFVVSRTKNRWYCFTRCQRGGDVIEFVRCLDDLSYRDTARRLASMIDGHHGACTHTVTAFQPYTRQIHLDPCVPFLAQKEIRPATARHFEAGIYRGRQGFLAGCVAVRIHDPVGRPLGYAGRRLDPDDARRLGKWKLPARLPKRDILFNFHRVRHRIHQGLAVVEDPWSVMRLAQLGIPAVALLGTALSEPQHRLLAPAPRLLLLLDGDPAGRTAAQALRGPLAHAKVGIAQLPESLDPDDLKDQELQAFAALFIPGAVSAEAVHPEA